MLADGLVVVMMPAVVMVAMVPVVSPSVMVAVPAAIVPTIVVAIVPVPAAMMMVPLAPVGRRDEPLLRGRGADRRCRDRRRAGAQAARTEHRETGGCCE